MRGLLAALVSVVVSLVGAPLAFATSVGESVQGPVHTYVPAAYVYDGPALLSSPDTATTYVRGSPSGPEAVSWASPVSVARDRVAANTGTAAGLVETPSVGRFPI